MTVIVRTTERVVVRGTPVTRVVTVKEGVERVVVRAPAPRGPAGEPGASAYDIAVANGFVGTEADWLLSLHGEGSTPTISFEANVAVASDTWGPFVHNLGYPPAVMLYGTDGKQITGRVVENTSEQTTVSFYWPVAGRITMS